MDADDDTSKINGEEQVSQIQATEFEKTELYGEFGDMEFEISNEEISKEEISQKDIETVLDILKKDSFWISQL